MPTIEVLIKSDPEFMPSTGHPGDAGYDLRSSETFTLPARGRFTAKTGVSIAMPEGYVGLVHPRSGLAAKSGITVLNSPGTVDAGYRGELQVTLVNHSDEDYVVTRGDRIAQIVFQSFEKVSFISVTELPGSQRGTNGFGSTGTN